MSTEHNSPTSALAKEFALAKESGVHQSSDIHSRNENAARTDVLVQNEPPARVAGTLTQIRLLMQWQLSRSAQAMPLLVVVQLLLAIATVVGYGFLVGDADATAGLYLTTGAPAISLVMVGLVMTPQWVAQSRTEGSLDWMRTLPIARPLFLIADLAIWTLIALPGLILGLVMGAARFNVELSPQWWIVPGALLVSLTAASVGYGIANLFPPPVAQVLSQVFVFVVLLFSPISFPAQRLPEWAQTVHQWLPFEPMAQIVRGGLASDVFTTPGRAWFVLGAWCALSVAGAVWALGRRP